MSNIFDLCLKIDENYRKPNDIGLIWEGNYWDDQDVHDCCDIDWETCEILVRKISHAIRQHVDKRQKLLIFLPKVIQLPLSILASYQAEVIPILLDPLSTSSIETAARLIIKHQPKLLITVDAMWQAQTLIEFKSKLEPICDHNNVRLLVIRHVSPNAGVPPPKRHYPARRPSYRVQLDLRDGKDLEWSDVMSRIPQDVQCPPPQWSDDDTVVGIGESDQFVTHSTLVSLLLQQQQHQLGLDTNNNVDNVLILDAPSSSLEHFVNFLTPWCRAKTLTLYEGPLNYPDCSRLAQICLKHHVDCVVATSSRPDVDYKLHQPYYLSFFDTSHLKLLISNSQILKSNLQVSQGFS